MNLSEALIKSTNADLLYVSIGCDQDVDRELHQNRLFTQQFPIFIQEHAKENPSEIVAIILISAVWKRTLPSILLELKVRMREDGVFIPYDFPNVHFYVVNQFFRNVKDTQISGINRKYSEESVLSRYIGVENNNMIVIGDFTITCTFSPLEYFPVMKASIRGKRNVKLMGHPIFEHLVEI